MVASPIDISVVRASSHLVGRNNDETRMTELEGMTNDQMLNDCDEAVSSSFGLLASFVIRHSCFVIAS